MFLTHRGGGYPPHDAEKVRVDYFRFYDIMFPTHILMWMQMIWLEFLWSYIKSRLYTRTDSFQHQNTMCISPCKRKIYGRNISVYCFCISVSHSPFIRTFAYEPYVSGIYKSPINMRFFYTRTRFFLFLIVIIDNSSFQILYNTRPYVEKRLYCFLFIQYPLHFL